MLWTPTAWSEACSGEWVDVHSISLDVAVRNHHNMGGILERVRVWQRYRASPAYAAGTLGLLHDGTVGMLLPRAPGQPPAA
jgi:hypothetical protein